MVETLNRIGKVIGALPSLDFESIPKDEHGAPIFTEEQKTELEEQKKINCPAGEGLVDWKALKEVADKHGCQAYIVEREYTPGEGTRLDVLKADLEYYRTRI